MVYNYENRILSIAINAYMIPISETRENLESLKIEISRSSLTDSEKSYLYNMINSL